MPTIGNSSTKDPAQRKFPIKLKSISKRNNHLTLAILDVLTASRPFSPSNLDELVLNHCTLLEPSDPPVTTPETVTLLFSLKSPIIFTFETLGGANIWQIQKDYYLKIMLLSQ